MLDTKKVGEKIAILRKKNGLSQERLADMLNISPQAISKWENGHTLPDISLLPLLSQIFNCTIDEMIMPAYSVDSKIDEKKPNILEQQAEYIAKYVVWQLGEKEMLEKIIGLDDRTIITTVKKANPDLENCEVNRKQPEEHDRYTSLHITVNTSQKELKLIEKIYRGDDKELLGYSLFNHYTTAIPKIYYLDFQQKVILMEDIGDSIQGFHFNEDNEYGNLFRAHYNDLIKETARLHTAFWENKAAFAQLGLDWRHETKENLLAYISGMEKDFLKYRNNEKAGKIPRVWNVFQNTIDLNKLDYFQEAIKRLRQEYPDLLNARFHSGKNITVIHGDLHPGNTFLSRSNNGTVKMIDMEAVRIGLCTEDLAMLIALHIEPDKKYAMPLIDHYYKCLCETIKEYPYEMFINDYKLSIMENMFFTIRLINSGIYDFSMRDKAMKAFETFVLNHK